MTTRFLVDQRWTCVNPALHGEIIEISDGGHAGTMLIKNTAGEVVDTYRGAAAALQLAGRWQLVWSNR